VQVYPAKIICMIKIGLISCSEKLLSIGSGFILPVSVMKKIKKDPSQAIKYDITGEGWNSIANAHGTNSTKYRPIVLSFFIDYDGMQNKFPPSISSTAEISSHPTDATW